MEVQVSENKNDVNCMLAPWNMVRVFVDRDFAYGHWIVPVTRNRYMHAQ